MLFFDRLTLNPDFSSSDIRDVDKLLCLCAWDLQMKDRADPVAASNDNTAI